MEYTYIVHVHPQSGIYEDGPIDLLYDVSGIPELLESTANANEFIVGAGTPIRDFIEMLESQATADPMAYAYGTQMAAHLKKVSK